MLVKSHSLRYLEDFGLKRGDKIYLYDQCIYGDDFGLNRGPVKAAAIPFSPVIRLNALWMNRDVKVKCRIADTEQKKAKGLQGFNSLPDYEGMYFPYLPYGEKVAFHQGTVPFGLDLLFLDGNTVTKIQENTKVGSKEHWECDLCTGVIEVRASFCKENKISVGDKVALFAVSERDAPTLEKESHDQLPVEATDEDKYFCYPTAVHLISTIADEL